VEVARSFAGYDEETVSVRACHPARALRG
jgi:hypothetical protein